MIDGDNTYMTMATRFRAVFFDKKFLRTLFTIALPIMLQNFLSAFVNILDTVMIGKLGTIELAAVGLGNQLFFLLNLILYGTGSGSMVFTAQFWGKKDFKGLQYFVYGLLCEYAERNTVAVYEGYCRYRNRCAIP